MKRRKGYESRLQVKRGMKKGTQKEETKVRGKERGSDSYYTKWVRFFAFKVNL